MLKHLQREPTPIPNDLGRLESNGIVIGFTSYSGSKRVVEWTLGELGVSINQLSKLLGAHPQTCYKWVWKQTRPSSAHLLRLLEVLRLKSENPDWNFNEVSYINWDSDSGEPCHIQWKRLTDGGRPLPRFSIDRERQRGSEVKDRRQAAMNNVQRAFYTPDDEPF